MDKSEYKTKLEEVEKLIASGNEEEGLYLLDTMSWRKVRNVNALLSASEIYEEHGRLDDARELLELAHERSPIGRMIIYRLALLCIRLETYSEAKDYYEEFVEIAPHDSLRYIISYKLAKAQGADNITLISILEELKEHDFLEEWAYELALLYHKSGQTEKCISVCDELILWYGDGPYVESAMELKMVHQPLDEQQENKYRSFKLRRDGITEVMPQEIPTGGKGEILRAPIEIPEVALSTDRFNTQNLQAEIKKNIEQIMNATEEEEVDDKMEGIKELVEEIPYAKVPKDATGPIEKAVMKKRESKKIDDTLKSRFKEYLAEEYDGQISLSIPETEDIEPQIAGQMTIDQVLADWQKTARAAEAALAEADEQQLLNVKAKAIEEATQIIDRLENAKEELDAGVAPKELLKKEYLDGVEDKNEIESLLSQDTRYLPAGAKATMETIKTLEEEGAESTLDKYATKRVDSKAVEQEAFKKQSTFKIPKIDVSGEASGVGLEVPIVEGVVAKEATKATGVIAGSLVDTAEAVSSENWNPEVFEPENDVQLVDKATEMVADVNDMLAKEIDRAERGTTTRLPIIDTLPTDDDASEQENQTESVPEEKTPVAEPRSEFAEESIIDEEQTRAFAEAVVALMKEESAENQQDDIDPEYEEEIRRSEDVLRALEADVEIEPEPEPEIVENIETSEPVVEVEESEEIIKQIEEDEVLPEIEPAEEVAESIYYEEDEDDDDDIAISEDAFSQAIYDEMPQTSLTKEEKELFTYFTPIEGMERSLCQILTGARARLSSDGTTSTGNIIIQGGEGSGKTTLATSIIQVLQTEIGKPSGNVGKIDGENLNGKDLNKLFSRIRNGCLIIEHAGDISRECALELSAQMEQDETGVLVILEDVRKGIERVMALNPAFSRKFTEKIVIPVMTIDELVNFGKAYAADMGYSIDEMGVLALYDRINLIQRFDHPTNLNEVKEIMDDAIDEAESGGGIKGFFGRLGSKHYDDAGNLILQEKDFQV